MTGTTIKLFLIRCSKLRRERLAGRVLSLLPRDPLRLAGMIAIVSRRRGLRVQM